MTLGSLFLDFEGTGKRLDFEWILMDFGSPGGPPFHAGSREINQDLVVRGPN